jgi:predicted DNA-binding transcriptional regulator YafY
VAGLDEIKRWILSFGPEALVLEPPKLRELVRKDLFNNGSVFNEPCIYKLNEGDSGCLN